MSAAPHRLDFTNTAWFGPGWATAETNGEIVYRWTTSREAELILPLPVGHDVLVTIQVGTHGGCSGQTVELRLGDLTLAAEQVGLDGAPVQDPDRRSRDTPRRPGAGPCPAFGGGHPARAHLDIHHDHGVEVVVSHNHSEDGTWELLNGLGDERLTVLRPPDRVDYASNADWAYRHARGEWLGHLGDEDQILSSRFAVLDHIASHRIPAPR